ncbi:APC family permease [Sphingomonas sp. NSE70-1]|uniref:Arginine/agmatine antiporter n=1 Tax=Sphingomonas caseinilyticus TaxID=2908205 RepID=A0ABT0RTI2_9SPHN|nr:APC family permease [Sphingomonas caseinilyticus]MCL6698146.1 APC family permease [Sphingomonas caseinilyticus]
MAEPADEQPGTRRDVGIWGAAFLALNGMIGAAIFGLPGKLDAAVGSFAPWLLLIAGLGVMLIALCYADLAARFDSSGGPQLYASAAFGPFIGFQAGWMLYAARAAALAANAHVLSAYAGALWPPLDGPVTIIVTIAAITLVNVVGIRRAVDTLGAMTMIKVAPLVLIGALGLVLAPIPTPVLPEFSAVESVSLVALYAFVGFEAATIPAGETRDPKRAIPRALLLTVAGVTLLYVVVQLAYSASGIGESDAPLADLAAQSLGPAGALLLGITAIVSVLANQLSAVTSISRITSSLSDQHLLPSWFGKISPRFSTPANSIVTVGGLGLALALSGTFVTLAVISTVSRLFAYLACIAAIPRLDAKERNLRPIGGILLPLASAALCLWAASQSRVDEWKAFIAFLLAGSLLYLLARLGRGRS